MYSNHKIKEELPFLPKKETDPVKSQFKCSCI
jgi:hypothetical protein